LFGRLMWYGFPSGLQVALDCLAFTFFTFLIGRLGEAELAASSIAFTINIVAFLPMLGIGQGVMILVGQRMGQEQPHLAERTAWRFGWGTYWAWGFASAYIILLAVVFFFRFLQGKWKSMRVIEPVYVQEEELVA